MTPGVSSERTGRRAIRGVACGVLLAVVAAVLVASPASADSIRDREYWLSSYGVTAAWNTTRGAGVTVAVIDTGIDGTHPDLTGQVIGGTDVSGIGAANGQKPIGEDSQHGTMVASMLAGHGHGSGAGVIGVAPAAKLLAVSIGFGVGTTNSDDQIATGVRWAVDNGAKIINMSLTRNTLDWPTSWDDAFLYAMQHDVIIVAAAGNRGSGTTEVGAPATMPGVVVVAGVNRAGKASFDASSQGITLTVAAPSEDLVGASPGGGYLSWAGTSGATPLVSGALALIRAAHPDLDAGDVINRLTKTATPAGDAISYGSGLLNVDKAVTATVAKVKADPADDLKEWIRLNRRATAAPTPAPSSTATPTPTPAPVAGASTPFGSVLPSVDALRNTGLPLLIYAAFLALLVLLVRGMVLEFRRTRRK
ncbi:MAG: peptidase [Microbacteriaceae bacterium]|nr:peptidase [Microbacteriaceae bacterium]